jgi:hypothetical protein
MDDPSSTLTISSPRLSPEVMAADAATCARIQANSVAVLVEAFAIAVVIDPDEPVPYQLTALGLAASEMPAIPFEPWFPGDGEDDDEEDGDSEERDDRP